MHKIIWRSHIPFTQFPAVVTIPHTTIVSCHNQATDFDTIPSPYSHILPVSTHPCVWCSFSSLRLHHRYGPVWPRQQSPERTGPPRGWPGCPSTAPHRLPSVAAPTPTSGHRSSSLHLSTVSFETCCTDGIIQYVAFWDGLFFFPVTVIPLDICWSLENTIFDSGLLVTVRDSCKICLFRRSYPKSVAEVLFTAGGSLRIW